MVRDTKIDTRRHFNTNFCENVVVMKASPQNEGDLVFLESQKGLAITIQNNCVKFVAHKE